MRLLFLVASASVVVSAVDWRWLDAKERISTLGDTVGWRRGDAPRGLHRHGLRDYRPYRPAVEVDPRHFRHGPPRGLYSSVNDKPLYVGATYPLQYRMPNVERAWRRYLGEFHQETLEKKLNEEAEARWRRISAQEAAKAPVQEAANEPELTEEVTVEKVVAVESPVTEESNAESKEKDCTAEAEEGEVDGEGAVLDIVEVDGGEGEDRALTFVGADDIAEVEEIASAEELASVEESNNAESEEEDNKAAAEEGEVDGEADVDTVEVDGGEGGDGTSVYVGADHYAEVEELASVDELSAADNLPSKTAQMNPAARLSSIPGIFAERAGDREQRHLVSSLLRRAVNSDAEGVVLSHGKHGSVWVTVALVKRDDGWYTITLRSKLLEGELEEVHEPVWKKQKEQVTAENLVATLKERSQ